LAPGGLPSMELRQSLLGSQRPVVSSQKTAARLNGEFHVRPCPPQGRPERGRGSRGTSLTQTVDVDSHFAVRVKSSYPTVRSEGDEEDPNVIRDRQEALRETLRVQQAQLDAHGVQLRRFRQRWDVDSSEVSSAPPPLFRQQARSAGSRGTIETSADRHRNREGARSAIREAERRAALEVAPDAVMTIDRTTAELAQKWREVQRAPRWEKPEKLKEVQRLKEHPDFIAAQRTLREAPHRQTDRVFRA